MNRLALAAAATAALGAAAVPSAYAGSNMNGPELTGVALETLEANQPAVTAVGLPPSDAIRLDQQAKPAASNANARQ